VGDQGSHTNVVRPRCPGSPVMTRGAPDPLAMQVLQLTPRVGSWLRQEPQHCIVQSCPPPDVPSHLTLRHANPVRGTQVPSTVGTHLHFGPDVSSLIHTKEG
jgi:hypothetical protein